MKQNVDILNYVEEQIKNYKTFMINAIKENKQAFYSNLKKY